MHLWVVLVALAVVSPALATTLTYPCGAKRACLHPDVEAASFASEQEFVSLLQTANTVFRTSSKGDAGNSEGAAEEPTAQDKEDSPVVSPVRSIDGRIMLNGAYYKAECTCEESGKASVLHSANCPAPVSIKVEQESHNLELGLSMESIHAIIGAPSIYEDKLVDTENEVLKCVDGRQKFPVLGVPGGGFFEFLLGLSEFEAGQGEPLEQGKVTSLFRDWLVSSLRGSNAPVVHMCTDAEAVSALRLSLHDASGVTGRVLTLDLAKPPKAVQAELLELLKIPRFHGCSMLQAALTSPEQFYLRKELVHMAVVAFYTTWWDQEATDAGGEPLADRMELEILEGAHKEMAWMEVSANYHCQAEHIAPKMTPLGDEKHSVWVSHTHGGDAQRAMLARFLVQQDGTSSLATMNLRLDRRAQQAREAFVEIAASSLPVYRVNFE